MGGVSLEDQFVIGLQLVLIALLSSIIGLNREKRSYRAGLRTHMLVGVGSCLFTALSLRAFPDGDVSRVASQILPGIGFLGAGTILKDGMSVYGLTTAASIWATAAVGMAVGTGLWFIAIIATLIIWVTLALVVRIEGRGEDENKEAEPSP